MRPPGLGLRRRVALGTSLSLAMAMPPFIQSGVAVLAPFLVEDLGLARTQVGTLTSVSFIVALLGGPWLGRLADLVGGRAVVGLLFTSGVLSLAGLGAAPGYPWLLAAILGAGLAMGAANPATNHLLASSISPGQRGLLMGIKQSGVKMGQLLSAATLPSLASALGWRTALFIASASAAAVGSLVTLVLPAHRDGRSARERSGQKGRLPPFVPVLVVYGFLMGMPQAAVNAYLPLYAFEGLGFSPAVAGAVAGLIGLVGMASRILWGRTAERLTSVARPLAIISIGTGLSLALLIAAQASGASAIVWGGAVLFGVTAPVWNVIAMLAVVSAAGGGSTGRASGMVFGGFAAGFIVGPVAFGAVVDLVGSYPVGWAGAMGSTVAAAIVAGTSRGLRTSAPGGSTPPHP